MKYNDFHFELEKGKGDKNKIEKMKKGKEARTKTTHLWENGSIGMNQDSKQCGGGAAPRQNIIYIQIYVHMMYTCIPDQTAV